MTSAGNSGVGTIPAASSSSIQIPQTPPSAIRTASAEVSRMPARSSAAPSRRSLGTSRARMSSLTLSIATNLIAPACDRTESCRVHSDAAHACSIGATPEVLRRLRAQSTYRRGAPFVAAGWLRARDQRAAKGSDTRSGPASILLRDRVARRRSKGDLIAMATVAEPITAQQRQHPLRCHGATSRSFRSRVCRSSRW